MEQVRKHYFPANDETVITGLCPNGEYGAYKLDYEDEPRIRGYGHTRMAAIADLVEAISDTEEDEERNSADFQIDHARDYRKHEAA
jgi:hypothetical protein